MPLLSSPPVSALGGLAAGLEAAQQRQNKLYRDLVDNTQMQLAPGKVWHTTGQQNAMATTTTDVRAADETIKQVVRGFLPHVCNKHVMDFKVRTQVSLAEDRHVVYAKWTFYNDQDVRLKAYVARAVEDPIDITNMVSLRLRTTVDCDLEEWQADAIMRCEAGEEVWERPKPNAFSGVSQAAGAQQGSLAQQGLQRNLQSSQGGLLSGLGQAAGGLLSGQIK